MYGYVELVKEEILQRYCTGFITVERVDGSVTVEIVDGDNFINCDRWIIFEMIDERMDNYRKGGVLNNCTQGGWICRWIVNEGMRSQ